MNALAATAPRPAPYQAVTYAAFRLDNGRASPLNIGEATSLTAAVDTAKLACLHKEVLAIRETDADGVRVHLYAIKRRAPQWKQLPGEVVPTRVAELYAEAVCVVPGSVFA